jgi:hypothetical protein
MSGLKVELFGIGDAVNGSQKNYLFEEGSAPFRAAIKKDQVISCLHDYLLPIKKPNLELTADNCSAQNKNQWLMNYLCWRVMKGLQKKIQLNFMSVASLLRRLKFRVSVLYSTIYHDVIMQRTFITEVHIIEEKELFLNHSLKGEAVVQALK